MPFAGRRLSDFNTFLKVNVAESNAELPSSLLKTEAKYSFNN